MNKEEYTQKLAELQKQYQYDRNAIMKEYALSNNPYSVDDIVTDHIGSLKIKEIKVYLSSNDPQCVYFGTELKKDFTPAKKQTNRAVYQSSLIPHRCFFSETGIISEEAFNGLKPH